MRTPLIRTAFAALSVFLSNAQPGLSQNPTPSNQTALSTQDEQVRSLMCEAKYTLLGDTAHGNPQIWQAIAAPNFLDHLSVCQIQTVFLEIGVQRQAILDAYANGTMTRPEFLEQIKPAMASGLWKQDADAMEKKAEAVEAFANFARTHGITIHAAGLGNGEDELLQGSLLYTLAFESYKKILPDNLHAEIDSINAGKGSKRMDEIVSFLEKNQDSDAYKTAEELFQKGADLMERGKALRTDDSLLYAFIQDKTSQKESRVLVIYGDGHMQSANGIYALLGPENARWITMATQSYAEKKDALQPHAIYRVDRAVHAPLMPVPPVHGATIP